jgi:hypothetical protein
MGHKPQKFDKKAKPPERVSRETVKMPGEPQKWPKIRSQTPAVGAR